MEKLLYVFCLASIHTFPYDSPPAFSASARDSQHQQYEPDPRNLTSALIGCAFSTLTVGCLAPWSTPASKGGFSRPSVARSSPPANAQTPIPPIGADDTATDMAGVMEKLSQVREMDPAAEQKLLDELKRTPPSSWPLVAEQYRASLAYHQQLAAKPPKTEQAPEPMAQIHRTPPPNAANDGSRSTSDFATKAALAAAANQSSTAIGALADPRGASTESDLILAQSLPYSMPRPLESGLALPTDGSAPAEFAALEPMYPIAAARGAGTESAAFQTPASDVLHVVTQALAKVRADEAIGKLPARSANEQISSATRSSPSTANAADEWQQLVQKAADDLSQHVATSPTTTAEIHQHVSLRLLRLLAGDTEQALEPIPHIPPAEQDYWSRQIFALATYLDHHSQPDDKRRAAASVAHLDEAVSHLRELGSLSLRNLSFCKNVYGYGAYEPYETDNFTPGQQVSLYVEVENFHSASNEKGYCTLLGATYEIVDNKGKRVSGGEFPDVDDCCRSRRRDFHIQFGLAMPESLSPGRYRVELVVKDRQSDKLGHATVPFEIRSGRK